MTKKRRLTHIVEAAALIADYGLGVSKEAFLNDRLRQEGVIRGIQIRFIGNRPLGATIYSQKRTPMPTIRI